MSSSESYTVELLDNIIIYLYKYIVPIIYIIGNIGNMFSALIFAKKSWRKNVCVFYFNVCLVFNTCFINSAILSSIFMYGFNINVQNFNVVLCKLYFYCVYVFATLSPTTLILASIDRLLISSQNVDTRLYSSKRLAYFSISISTIFWVLFFIHLLIKINLQQLYVSYFECSYDLFGFYYQFISYSSLIINCFMCFTMIILCMLAFKNVRRIRAIPRQQRQHIRIMTKKDFQLLRCLFAYDIVFIIFSIALTIFTVYEAATIHQVRTSWELAIINFINSFSTFLNFIPFCASFYIFIIVSKSFRNEMKRMIYKIFNKDVEPIREEENKQENIVAVVDHVVS